MGLRRTPFFEELSERIKSKSRRDDVVVLVAWMLTHYNDDGLLRSPQTARRKTIVLDGVTYWLVRAPAGKDAG